jgi:hypothetical protein
MPLCQSAVIENAEVTKPVFAVDEGSLAGTTFKLMQLDLIDLRLFLQVAEAGSITQGARRAHLALAAASTRIRRDTPIKVNSAHPGWVKTELGGAGAKLDITEGGKTSVQLATLSANGPTGAYIHLDQKLPC